MVMQNQRLELLYNEAECYFYAITNCIGLHDGHSDNPGFKVTMRGLNREIWQTLKPSLEVNSADDEDSLPDDVALEILYCLLGGKGSESYRDEIGWEIISIEIHSESSLCINVANRQFRALNYLLSHADRQNAPPGQFVPTLQSKVPTGDFWVCWPFGNPRDYATFLDVKPLNEDDDEEYTMSFGEQLHVTEDLPHRRRDLYFQMVIERDGQEYLVADVEETLY